MKNEGRGRKRKREGGLEEDGRKGRREREENR